MYSTCLFCYQDLGKNAAVEHFPVGRRLAFDAAKGRLWVVCRKCERWNLTPLEERWEAVEECERAFRATKLRVSTDHIGLARLKEGTELVRIGEPQRPEMAAWRYGDQFGRRRHKRYAMVAGAAVIGGTVLVAGPLLGLVSLGGVAPFVNVFNTGSSIYRHKKLLHIPAPGGTTIPMRLSELPKARLQSDGDEIGLTVPIVASQSGPWWHYKTGSKEIELNGMDAVRAAGALLPRLNHGGGSSGEIIRAVEYLEQSSDPVQLFRRAAVTIAKRSERFLKGRYSNSLQMLPIAGRLALEMAAHEDAERPALEGELHRLEAAWKDAEEIAGIADDLFLPESVADDLARLKRQRDQ